MLYNYNLFADNVGYIKVPEIILQYIVDSIMECTQLQKQQLSAAAVHHVSE